MTLGKEFSGYAAAVRRAQDKLEAAVRDLQVLILGGTAIGTGLVTARLQKAVYQYLSIEIGKELRPAVNMFDGM